MEKAYKLPRKIQETWFLIAMSKKNDENKVNIESQIKRVKC